MDASTLLPSQPFPKREKKLAPKNGAIKTQDPIYRDA